MNRSIYYNYIEEKITTLCTRIELRGKLNILDYHIHSENFYRDLFNQLYGWNLENLNAQTQNIEAIDLIDKANNIIIQVSATNTKAKIDGALNKPILASSTYSGFRFKFISISKNASDLQRKSYDLPPNISFTPSDDIYDVKKVLQHISNLDINKMKIIYNLIKNELGRETEVIRLESNLSLIINSLSKENLETIELKSNLNVFEIERKINFNDLNYSKYTIDDYKLYHHMVDKIYSEFDKQGYNKSISVFQNIRSEYIKNSNITSADTLFDCIIAKISNKVMQSSNFEIIPQDEMEMCVGILVVDAFIRCKIFKNPENYNYATT